MFTKADVGCHAVGVEHLRERLATYMENLGFPEIAADLVEMAVWEKVDDMAVWDAIEVLQEHTSKDLLWILKDTVFTVFVTDTVGTYCNLKDACLVLLEED